MNEETYMANEFVYGKNSCLSLIKSRKAKNFIFINKFAPYLDFYGIIFVNKTKTN